MTTKYSERLGSISSDQFQRALDHFNLGQFISAEPIPFGLFGQNVFVTSTAGEFVLRGTAHYDWQFPKEQFIANLLHQQTTVPVPWPYLLDPDESIFSWSHGYVLMPRMPGLQLADSTVLKTLSPSDRAAIAYTLGENLRRIQQARWQFAGEYDLATQTIQPFEGGFAAWLIRELRHLAQQSLAYNTGTTTADLTWIDHIIAQASDSLAVPAPPVLVMHDYKEANLTVQKQADRWIVSGVFDLMEAIVGDGELDLARQLAAYLEFPDMTLAKSFLSGYTSTAPLRPHADKRLALYLLYDRMIIWEYFHRPSNLSQWWAAHSSAETWISFYLNLHSNLI